MEDIYAGSPQVLRDFLSYIEVIRGKSSNTVKEYFFDLRTFFRFIKLHKGFNNLPEEFNEILIDDVDINLVKTISLSDLYEYLSFVNRNRKNDAPTRARKVASLKTFFKYLNLKAGLLSDNPAKELDSPKIKKSLPKYLSLDEARSLLKAVDGDFKERDICIITLFLHCGLRLSELTNINIYDIKEDSLTVVGKGNKERTIYLNKVCISSIRNYLDLRPKDGVKDPHALFISKQKKRISPKTIQYIVKKYLDAAGLDITRFSAHKLRHTAATLMYQYGNVDIRVLQEILGHKNLSTTEIYTHLDNEQLRKAAQSNPLANE